MLLAKRLPRLWAALLAGLVDRWESAPSWALRGDRGEGIGTGAEA